MHGQMLRQILGRDLHRERICWLVSPNRCTAILILTLMCRVMRKTGKLYGLTLVSAVMTVAAAVLVVMWNEDSSAFHLWLDIVPQGLGMASVITTTLIVRSDCLRLSLLHAHRHSFFQAMIASVGKEDLAVATGSESNCYLYMSLSVLTRYDSHLSLQDNRAGPWR